MEKTIVDDLAEVIAERDGYSPAMLPPGESYNIEAREIILALRAKGIMVTRGLVRTDDA